MSLKNALKSRICLTRVTPNYPLEELVEWLDSQNSTRDEVLQHLDDIQDELEIEAEALRRYSNNAQKHERIHGYWSHYCSEVRAYFRDQPIHGSDKSNFA